MAPITDPFASIAKPLPNQSAQTPDPQQGGDDPFASIAKPLDPNASPQDLANQALAGSGIKVGGMPNATPPELAKPVTKMERLADTVLHSDTYNVLKDIGDNLTWKPGLGFLKGAGQTALGADNIIRAGMRKAGLDAPAVDETDFGLEKGDLETHGFGENVGDIAENVVEWLAGEGEVKTIGEAGKAIPKLMGKAEQLEKLSQAAKVLTKWRPLELSVSASMSAMKQAMIAGAQTFAKTGGDKEAAQNAAIWTAGLGLLAHGIGSGMAEWIRGKAATEEIIGGQKVTIPAELRNIKPTAEQAAGQAVYRDTAQEAAREPLENINKTRVPEPRTIVDNPTDENKYFDQAKQELGENASVRDVLMRAQELKQAAVTAPVADSESVSRQVAQNNARTELGSTASTVPDRMMPKAPPASQVGSQAATIPDSVLGKKAPAEARVIVGDLKPTSPHPRIDIDKELSQVHDFTGAANKVEEHAAQIYNKANELSGGAFKEAKNAGDFAKVEDVINSLKGKLSPQEIDAARLAFRRSYVLQKIGNTLDTSWSAVQGNGKSGAFYRGFDGNALMGGLQDLVKQMGRGEVEKAIGGQRLYEMERIADLNRTDGQRARFGAAVKAVAKYLVPHVTTAAVGGYLARKNDMPWEVGAVAGFAGGEAISRVMKAVLANPRVAQHLIFAMQSGARPEVYGPTIGTMIQRQKTADSRERGQQQ